MVKNSVQAVIRTPVTVPTVSPGNVVVDNNTGIRYVVTNAIRPQAPAMWWKAIAQQEDALDVTPGSTETTITVLGWTQLELDAEPYSGVEPSLVRATGVRAEIKDPGTNQSGSRAAGGEQERVIFPFRSAICPVSYLDWVKDERTDAIYQVEWVEQNGNAMVGRLKIVRGGV